MLLIGVIYHAGGGMTINKSFSSVVPLKKPDVTVPVGESATQSGQIEEPKQSRHFRYL